MHQTFSTSVCRHQRYHATGLHKDILVTIRNFVIRNDSEDWKRGLVCGI
jgi:hypothetical protein